MWKPHCRRDHVRAWYAKAQRKGKHGFLESLVAAVGLEPTTYGL